jgi:hypothetical protein
MLRISMRGPPGTTIDVALNPATSAAQWNSLESDYEHSERLSKIRANLDWTCGLRDRPWLSQSIAIRPSLRAAHRRSSVLRCQGRLSDV